MAASWKMVWNSTEYEYDPGEPFRWADGWRNIL